MACALRPSGGMGVLHCHVENLSERGAWEVVESWEYFEGERIDPPLSREVEKQGRGEARWEPKKKVHLESLDGSKWSMRCQGSGDEGSRTTF